MAARKKTVEFQKRSRAAVRGWETREAKRIEREALEAAEFERRSRAALRGWKTRNAAERIERAYERAEREGIRAEGAEEPKAKPEKAAPPRYRKKEKGQQPKGQGKGKRSRKRSREEEPPRGFVELLPNLEERKKRHQKVRENFRDKLLDLYENVGDRAKQEKTERRKKKRPKRLTKIERLQRLLVDGLLETGENLDETVHQIAEEEKMTRRELYSLFFSPEAA